VTRIKTAKINFIDSGPWLLDTVLAPTWQFGLQELLRGHKFAYLLISAYPYCNVWVNVAYPPWDDKISVSFGLSNTILALVGSHHVSWLGLSHLQLNESMKVQW